MASEYKITGKGNEEEISAGQAETNSSKVIDYLTVGTFFIGVAFAAHQLRKNPGRSRDLANVVADLSRTIQEGTDTAHKIAEYAGRFKALIKGTPYQRDLNS